MVRFIQMGQIRVRFGKAGKYRNGALLTGSVRSGMAGMVKYDMIR